MSEGGRPGGRRAGSLLGAPVIVRDLCRLGKFILWWVSKPGRGGGGEEVEVGPGPVGGEVGPGGDDPPEEDSRWRII